jgi:PhnO protein
MISIRVALADDVNFVCEIINLLEHNKLDEELIKQKFLNCLKSQNQYYFIAEVNLNPVAFAALNIQSPLHNTNSIAEIQELVVLDNYRNTGVGSSLIDFLTNIAKECGCETIELASNANRIDAHRFYLRNNFVQTHYKFSKLI